MDVCLHHTTLAVEQCPLSLHGGGTGRKRLVAALLRFSDELDVSSNRVDMTAVSQFAVNPDNAVFWWLHNLSKVTFNPPNVFRLTVLLSDTDYKELGPLVQKEYLDRFKTKNQPVLEVLQHNGFPIYLNADGSVVSLRTAPPLPDPIKEALTTLGATQSSSDTVLVEKQVANFSSSKKGSYQSTTSTLIQAQIRDVITLIQDKTDGFVGRRFVFDAFDTFTEKNNCGYFIVQGDPGLGKTAMSAELVRACSYVHHFNIRAEGVNRPEMFLRNVCAQLIAAHNLPYETLPTDAANDVNFLNKLLAEVAARLRPGEKQVIVVDALDEVEMLGVPIGVNRLYLPRILPKGLYVFATQRREQHLQPLGIDVKLSVLNISQEMPENLQDIRDYLVLVAERPRLKDWIVSQGLRIPDFVNLLEPRSKGNFMYLRYVVPEIESGGYRDTNLSLLPSGLEDYYERHWQRMKGQDIEAWFAYKLPVLAALVVLDEPVSIPELVALAGIPEGRWVREAVNEWLPFLYESQVPVQGVAANGQMKKCYRLYHPSFSDFVAAKDEIDDERVRLNDARQKALDFMFHEIGFDLNKPF